MDAAVKEERPVRKPADNVVAPVLLDNPVPSHAGIIPKRGYCINTTVSISSDPNAANLSPKEHFRWSVMEYEHS